MAATRATRGAIGLMPFDRLGLLVAADVEIPHPAGVKLAIPAEAGQPGCRDDRPAREFRKAGLDEHLLGLGLVEGFDEDVHAAEDRRRVAPVDPDVMDLVKRIGIDGQ